MLFHSIEFLLLFLPITFAGTAIIRATLGMRASLVWLSAASIFFYGQWSVAHGAILFASLMTNFLICRGIILADERVEEEHRQKARRFLFFLGIAANLGLLGYLKYANFLIDNINMTGSDLGYVEVIAPIGVSFFSFIQIGFIVETYNRQLKNVKLVEYFLFGSFFGYLTAGPLVLQRDMMPQYQNTKDKFVDPQRIALALTVIGFGLFKKLALADSIAPFADAIFDTTAAGGIPSVSLAWIGALAYAAQLYFDFSGYSDMALGIGLLFGLKLPFNFNSPFKATSIMDFWHRWHMTMSRFFTNYIFAPLAVNQTRKAMMGGYSPVKRFMLSMAAPVFITFVLAGIWHGSGWTFVVFGVIHGLAMAINHGWRHANMPTLPPAVGWLLTMGVVIAGLVVFRASNMDVAMTMLTAMVAGEAAGHVWVISSGQDIAINLANAIALISILFAVALLMPNTQQVLRGHEISCDRADEVDEAATPFWVRWRPTPRWACAMALVVAISIGLATGDTAFIYYKF